MKTHTSPLPLHKPLFTVARAILMFSFVLIFINVQLVSVDSAQGASAASNSSAPSTSSKAASIASSNSSATAGSTFSTVTAVATVSFPNPMATALVPNTHLKGAVDH